MGSNNQTDFESKAKRQASNLNESVNLNQDLKQNTFLKSDNSVSLNSKQNQWFLPSLSPNSSPDSSPEANLAKNLAKKKQIFGLGWFNSKNRFNSQELNLFNPSTTDNSNFKSKSTNTWSTSKDINSQSPVQNFIPKGARDSQNYKGKTKEKVVSITYEEIGLFPRSFSRVFDRFFKQIFSDVENLVIQEYRFYRYLFLTTIQTIFILLFVPLVVNLILKNYLIRPITEYYWNTKQTEIFLNSYEQKRAFVELQDFEEKLYFESLLISNNFITSIKNNSTSGLSSGLNNYAGQASSLTQTDSTKDFNNFALNSSNLNNTGLLGLNRLSTPDSSKNYNLDNTNTQQNSSTMGLQNTLNPQSGLQKDNVSHSDNAAQLNNLQAPWFLPLGMNSPLSLNTNTNALINSTNNTALSMVNDQNKGVWPQSLPPDGGIANQTIDLKTENLKNSDLNNHLAPLQNVPRNQYSLFLALADSLQEKTLELAIRYNNHSIESITNFFADFISLITLLYLLVSLEIQINITKSFLLEVFFGLDDSKKSLLILIMTDLLVGYHSSNLWELFFQFIFNHYGIPESQTGIFLLVATLPVLLDVLFKYLIFRHLNRSSPATVATYHAIIE